MLVEVMEQILWCFGICKSLKYLKIKTKVARPGPEKKFNKDPSVWVPMMYVVILKDSN